MESRELDVKSIVLRCPNSTDRGILVPQRAVMPLLTQILQRNDPSKAAADNPYLGWLSTEIVRIGMIVDAVIKLRADLVWRIVFLRLSRIVVGLNSF
jgi:hypothetical protein